MGVRRKNGFENSLAARRQRQQLHFDHASWVWKMDALRMLGEQMVGQQNGKDPRVESGWCVCFQLRPRFHAAMVDVF